MTFQFFTDWFSRNIPEWEIHLQHLRNKPGVRIGEVGSWEGRSTCWLLENILTHETASITCIDPFPVIPKSLLETYATEWNIPSPLPEYIDIEQRFDDNVRLTGATHKVQKLKGLSQKLLRTLALHTFDIMYIDGSHHPTDVLRDTVLCWDLLKEGGILILDDYRLVDVAPAMGNPKPAIDAFLSVFSHQCTVLHMGWQVIVRKHSVRECTSAHPAVGQSLCNTDKPLCISMTWARDEEDILEYFVRHNCSIVDRMIIVLHNTTDRSQEILRSLQQEGLPIEVREHAAIYHAQGDVLTELMHEVAMQYDPQWILPLDADEFLCSTGNTRNILRATLADTVIQLPWKTYVPTPKDSLLESDLLRRIIHRRAQEPLQYYKVMIPETLAAQSTLPLGSHQLLRKDMQIPHPSRIHPDLWLAHFPVRSEQQLRNKVINGWEAHSRNPQRQPGQIYQWEELYDRCKDRTPIFDTELQTIASSYATHYMAEVDLIEDPIKLYSKVQPV